MSCFHPLKAFEVGLTPSGKADLKVVPYSICHVERTKYGDLVPSDLPIVSSYAVKVYRKFVEIPCGKCIGCRLEYSRQWANRCMLELQYHDSAYFVTLTYDEEHIPISYYPDSETGEALPSQTLCKTDFQLFMKRLRKKFGENIRFFAAGEYGSTTFRPHYHAIIFGLKLDDLVLYKCQRGFNYYNSQSLQDIWSRNVGSNRSPRYDPLGYAVVAPVTWETCAYTARYVMKKLKGPEADFYTDFALEPPFTLMSRNPGIAYQWYVDHPDYRQYDYINIATETGGRKFRPPKYFDYLFDLDLTNKEESDIIKQERKKKIERLRKIELSKTDLDYLDYLKVKELNLEDRIKSLRREDI